MMIIEAYFRLAHPLLNSLFRVIVVTEIIEACCLNRLSCVMVVTEIIEACCLNRLSRVMVVTEIIEVYFCLAPPLLTASRSRSSSGPHHGEGG